MAWLLSGGRVLASVEIAHGARERARGLLGRDHLDGALLLRPAKGVHTVGMRFPIDVIYLDRGSVVIDIVTMRPHRVGRPRLRAAAIIEAAAGSVDRWGVAVGDELVVTDTTGAPASHP